jgi:hypothetical protein
LKFPRYCSVGSSIRPLDVHSFVRRSPRNVSVPWTCCLLSVSRRELPPSRHWLTWGLEVLSFVHRSPRTSRKIFCITSSSTGGRGERPRKFRVAVSNTPRFLRRFVQQSPESRSVSRVQILRFH